MTSVWELANPQLRDLAVYEPGKPIEETARELGVDPSTIIKLASNENPLGFLPRHCRRCAPRWRMRIFILTAADFTCAKQSQRNLV
jgi:Histidinol-phosphate/aromatic aminotransferase and cobyric acid decarboxylase